MSDDLTPDLRSRLREAMVARDKALVSAFRAALAAIANAEAVPGAENPATSSRHVAGSVAGVGAAEAPRRNVGSAEQRSLIAAEVDDLREAAATRARAGLASDADGLLRAAAALASVIESG